MLTRLLLLFIVVPIIELILLIEIGQLIGTAPTIGLILFTGVVGAFLARRQGMQVISRMRRELGQGQLPTDSIFDGVIILIAGAFLMTPGVLTDVLGFLCLVPATRRLIKSAVLSRMERIVQRGQFYTATYNPTNPPQPPEDVIILDPEDYK